MSDPMQPFNGELISIDEEGMSHLETTRTGCNSEEYSWCDTQLVSYYPKVAHHSMNIKVVNIVPYIIILIITSSFAVPSSMLSLDTIYSKIIGDIDQVCL